jgi:hypothetical protein
MTLFRLLPFFGGATIAAGIFMIAIYVMRFGWRV